MGRNRKTYSESFKKQVAIEAMDGKRTVAEIAASNNLFINLPTKLVGYYFFLKKSRQVAINALESEAEKLPKNAI